MLKRKGEVKGKTRERERARPPERVSNEKNEIEQPMIETIIFFVLEKRANNNRARIRENRKQSPPSSEGGKSSHSSQS